MQFFTGVYQSVTYNNTWDIYDIQCKCDLLTLDNSLENEYASHLLSGKSLPINFCTWNHTNQSTGNDNNFSATISRALTRLKSVVVTLKADDHADYPEWKTVNDFYHPAAMNSLETVETDQEHQVWIQIGSKLMPAYPIASVNQAYYQIKTTVGSSMNRYARWYRTHKYILAFDCEKTSGAGFTGTNTKAGDLLTINFRNCDLPEGATYHTIMSCALHYDCVLNIKDSGTELLD